MTAGVFVAGFTDSAIRAQESIFDIYVDGKLVQVQLRLLIIYS